jgi:heterodisulfide reductase subunit A
VGMGPAEKTGQIAERFGIPVEDTGFIKPVHDAMDTVATIRPGVYLAGTATAPRDIPDSVASGGSAAMRAYMDAVRTPEMADSVASEEPVALQQHKGAVRTRSE